MLLHDVHVLSSGFECQHGDAEHVHGAVSARKAEQKQRFRLLRTARRGLPKDLVCYAWAPHALLITSPEGHSNSSVWVEYQGA
jgi:hypothetical protein